MSYKKLVYDVNSLDVEFRAQLHHHRREIYNLRDEVKNLKTLIVEMSRDKYPDLTEEESRQLNIKSELENIKHELDL